MMARCQYLWHGSLNAVQINPGGGAGIMGIFQQIISETFFRVSFGIADGARK